MTEPFARGVWVALDQILEGRRYMKTEFLAKGFTHTKSTNQFLKDVTAELVGAYLKNDRDIHLRVTVDEDRHRSQGRKPHFVCEIQLKCASSKRYWKVHKASDDFHSAVLEASHAMRTVLQKRSSRRHDLKHGFKSPLKTPIEQTNTVESDTSAA